MISLSETRFSRLYVTVTDIFLISAFYNSFVCWAPQRCNKLCWAIEKAAFFAFLLFYFFYFFYFFHCSAVSETYLLILVLIRLTISRPPDSRSCAWSRCRCERRSPDPPSVPCGRVRRKRSSRHRHWSTSIDQKKEEEAKMKKNEKKRQQIGKDRFPRRFKNNKCVPINVDDGQREKCRYLAPNVAKSEKCRTTKSRHVPRLSSCLFPFWCSLYIRARDSASWSCRWGRRCRARSSSSSACRSGSDRPPDETERRRDVTSRSPWLKRIIILITVKRRIRRSEQ